MIVVGVVVLTYRHKRQEKNRRENDGAKTTEIQQEEKTANCDRHHRTADEPKIKLPSKILKLGLHSMMEDVVETSNASVGGYYEIL